MASLKMFRVSCVLLLPSLASFAATEAAPSEPASDSPVDTESPKALAGEVRSFGGAEFCWVPPGTFQMGGELRPAEVQRRYGKEGLTKVEWFEREHPSHPVTLSEGYWLGKTEVTVGQFRSFVNATGYQTEAEQQGKAWVFAECAKGWEEQPGHTWRNPGWTVAESEPVTCVSWNDVQAYIAWLNKGGTGRYALPTEAQWEYACRAGTQSPYYWGLDASEGAGWLNAADQTKGPMDCSWGHAFAFEDGHWFVAPVGSYRANGWGLHDMLGNVLEWCADWHGRYSGAAQTDPAGAASGEFRVLRGGSWGNDPTFCRASSRNFSAPDNRGTGTGFRLLRMR